MILKALKKLISALTVLSMLLLGFTPTLSAASLGMGGLLISTTPFDHKMNEAGALADHLPLNQTDSSENLFIKAKTIRYVLDNPKIDHWQSPTETESRWTGDCEDKAIWLYTQLKKNGYRNIRLVIGRYRNVSRGFHVWVTFADEKNETLYLLDPTSQKRLWKSSDFSEGFYKPLFSFDGTNRYRHDS